MLPEEEKAFKEWKRLSEEERGLLLIATEKYNYLYTSGLAPWIEGYDFIKSGVWKIFLTDNRIGVA